MRRSALLLLLALLLPATAKAQELRLVTGELPPYTFHVPPPTVAETGQPMGIVYEVVREIAWRIGHSGTVEFLPWARAQDIAMTEQDVAILSLTRTPEREPHYRWILNVITDDLVMVGGAGVDASDLAKLKDRPTGVLLRSGAEVLLRAQGFTRVQPASEEWLNAYRLKNRLIDAWLAPRLMVLHAYREVGGDVGELNIGQVVRPSEIWLAGSLNLSDAEIATWRRAFEEVKADGTYERIVERYVRMRPDVIPDEQRQGEIRWVN